MTITWQKIDHLERLGFGKHALEIAKQSGAQLYRAASVDDGATYYWYVTGLRDREGVDGLGTEERAAIVYCYETEERAAIVYCYERDVAFRAMADDIIAP